MRVQADAPFRARAEDIGKLKVRSASGAMVPLAALLTVDSAAGPERAMRYNGFLSADISGGPAPGYSSGQAQAAVERIAAETLPPGFAFEWTDLTYQQIIARITSYNVCYTKLLRLVDQGLEEAGCHRAVVGDRVILRGRGEGREASGVERRGRGPGMGDPGVEVGPAADARLEAHVREAAPAVFRITSYNVCYTKLLRVCAAHLSPTFEDANARWTCIAPELLNGKAVARHLRTLYTVIIS